MDYKNSSGILVLGAAAKNYIENLYNYIGEILKYATLKSTRDIITKIYTNDINTYSTNIVKDLAIAGISEKEGLALFQINILNEKMLKTLKFI